jgi:hypothetical protein
MLVLLLLSPVSISHIKAGGQVGVGLGVAKFNKRGVGVSFSNKLRLLALEQFGLALTSLGLFTDQQCCVDCYSVNS